MRTVKDTRFPKRSEMREFGKVYNGTEDVYIKIRVELLGLYGNTTTFVNVISFCREGIYSRSSIIRKIGGVFMDMKIIKSEKRICPCCMEEHVVKTVLIMDQATFKNSTVNYEASYFFCELTKELYMDEQQMQDNDIRLKDAYRKKEGLLTSAQIGEIRAKYGISQSDLCLLLGWGGKTITRYESHQVQDKAHDTILKKIDQDPEWFLSLLNGAKANLSAESYQKYLAAASLYTRKIEMPISEKQLKRASKVSGKSNVSWKHRFIIG